MTSPLGRRFESKFAADANGCWIWQASLSHNGYGRFYFQGRTVKAHRYAYERLVGPIAEGLTIDHLCRVPACVNPDHLEPVTMRVNVLRSDSLGGINNRKTSCESGHPFDSNNTYRWRGKRFCRTCQRQAAARYRARRRAEMRLLSP